MCGAQFGVAMPNAFVDRARDFTAFDVGRSDVAHGAHDGGSQGFYAVTQMALYLKYGLYPSDMATGGAGLIDKTNTEKAEAWAGKTR